ncbi:MAG: Rrf2 family transcriptional regulator [Chloroflexi bacterium]|nr:Rrf2 family transcriptional regulator [Chloroflexota bacterium]
MLGISTKGHYGLVIMTALALVAEGTPLSLARIAEETGISLGYLEQIVATLKENGLVESVRGAKGGYVLGREPSEITAHQIILATEREIAPISCSLQPDEGVCCHRVNYCPTVFLWGRLEQQLSLALGDTTLEDLARHSVNNKRGTNSQSSVVAQLRAGALR